MTSQDAIKLANQFANDDEIDRLLVDLLRAPSPQTELQEADPNLKKFVAGFVAPRLQRLTGSAAALDGMGNLLWQSGANNGEPGLLLMGYAMTFPAGGMKEPFSGAIVDGAPFGIAGNCAMGRGACEQKGALAAMIYAACDRRAIPGKTARAIVSRCQFSWRDWPPRCSRIYSGK